MNGGVACIHVEVTCIDLQVHVLDLEIRMAVSAYPGFERWRGKTALVTGASCGIGYDLSKRLCELGMNVVGCARNVSKIQALSAELQAPDSGRLVAVECDVKKEEDIRATFEVAKREFGGVDVCVSNAGLAHDAPLLSGSTQEWRDMLEVNVLGLCMCNREFMTQLKERGVDEGHMFLINSTSGHRLPILSDLNLNFYSATKYAVTALTEGVRRELRAMKSKVRVTSISPGMVRTEFFARLTKKEDEAETVQKSMGDVLESEDITSAIVYTLSTPPRMEINDILVRPTIQEH